MDPIMVIYVSKKKRIFKQKSCENSVSVLDIEFNENYSILYFGRNIFAL